MRLGLLLARKTLGMTQEKLAKKVGISAFTYSRIESGDKKTVDYILADNIAKAVGSNIVDVFLLPKHSQKTLA